MRDRQRERERIRLRRERTRVATEANAAELLSCADSQGRVDGAEMSVAGFMMLRDLISRSGHGDDVHADVRTVTEYGVRCTVHRVEGASTAVKCPEGRLVMHDLVVSVTVVEEAAPAPSDRPAGEADTAVRHQTEAPEDMVMTGAAT